MGILKYVIGIGLIIFVIIEIIKTLFSEAEDRLIFGQKHGCLTTIVFIVFLLAIAGVVLKFL